MSSQERSELKIFFSIALPHYHSTCLGKDSNTEEFRFLLILMKVFVDLIKLSFSS